MRAEEIRGLSDGDLTGRIAELEREQFNLRFKGGTQPLEDPLRLRVLRKDIARLKTEATERKLGIVRTAPEAATTTTGAAKKSAAKKGAAKKAAAKKSAAKKPAAKQAAAKSSAAKKTTATKTAAAKTAKRATAKKAPTKRSDGADR